MEKGLKEKTGKSLDHWIAHIHKSGLQKHSDIINHLKSVHSFTHGYANFVSLKARSSDAGSMDDEALLANQYKGKEDLKPIYNCIIELVDTFGTDIKYVPKKAAVSLLRKKQFALIKPATKSRIDLGIKLKDVAPEGRLEPSGPFGTMVTHRVRIENNSDVDNDVEAWLRSAYEKAI